MIKKRRAFLKWAGGKYLLMQEIRQHLPEGEILVEPFVGAGTVFLNTNYERYLLADINNDLITLFKTVKQKPEKFIKDAKLLFTEQNNSEAAFYQFRHIFNTTDNPYERSLIFLYLNRHGYNGLCRYNSKGEYNVPFGSYKKIYFPENEIFHFAEKAQKAKFVCKSYDKVLRKLPENCVVYCDPPYEPLSESANFTAYHTAGFNQKDQQKLATLAQKAASKFNASILISNHDTPNTRKWYNSAQLYNVQANRSISCSNLTRQPINELLALYTPQMFNQETEE